MDVVRIIDRLAYHKVTLLTKRELYRNFFDVYLPGLSYWRKRKLLQTLIAANVLTPSTRWLRFNKARTEADAIMVLGVL